jgi:UDP-galactopyranose mutase
MTRASETRRVWFVEEPSVADRQAWLDVRRVTPTLSVVAPHLPDGLTRQRRLTLQTDLLQRLTASMAQAPVHWYYTPMAREFASSLRASAIVYDCMDELSEFAGAPASMRVWESELMAAADVVFTAGPSLYEAKRSRHPQVFAFPGAVDVEHFRAARLSLPDHEAQSAVAHPRVGFAGVIDEWIDYDLVRAIAARRPDYQFVFAGPVVKVAPEHLPRAANIHYLGMQPYRDLPRLMSGWGAAILPFAKNESTRFVGTAKAPEYLAAGRRVVSTSIRDVVHPYVDLIAVADEPDAFVAALDVALSGMPEGWLEAADCFLDKLTWDRTWRKMHSHVLQAEGRRQATGAPVNAVLSPRRGGVVPITGGLGEI